MTARILWAILISLFLFSDLCAVQSAITEAEGYSCTGKKKLRKLALKQAVEDSKQKAKESVASYIRNETKLNNPELENYIIDAYSQADIRILDSNELGWYKHKKLGNCLKVLVKAEIIPDKKIIEKAAEDTQLTDNPSAPLNVQLWTEKKEYRNGEKIKIYFKGNKPFYARVLYKDSKGVLSQLLPNPYRQDNYFNAGTVNEIPSGNDKFEIEAMPPFNEENIIIYSGTSQLGDLEFDARGSVYRIKTKEEGIGEKTRMIKPKESGSKIAAISEFYENNTLIRIEKGEIQQVKEEPAGPGKTDKPSGVDY